MAGVKGSEESRGHFVYRFLVLSPAQSRAYGLIQLPEATHLIIIDVVHQLE
ncbi:MAG: hypothetical protein ABFS56_20055 [Pseudomonadota bacterium]